MSKQHTKKFSIPCFWDAPTQSENALKKSRDPSKFTSGRSSPQQSKLKKFTVPDKYFTRQNSPKDSIRNSPTHREIKPKVPSHIIKRKKIIKKKPQKTEEKLLTLHGKEIKYAPKIYHNQIFSDVYDELGRHDRIMEFELSMETHSTESPKLIILGDLEIPTNDQKIKPPENSFLEETCQDSQNILKEKGKLNLFARLELISKERK